MQKRPHMDVYLWYDTMYLYHVLNNAMDIITALDVIFNIYCAT